MRDPEAEADGVVLPIGLPREGVPIDVGDDLPDATGQLGAIDRDHLRRGIDRRDRARRTDKPLGPDAGSRRELENVAARPERVERREDRLRLRVPATIRLRPVIVTPATGEPLVVFADALAVILDHLGERVGGDVGVHWLLQSRVVGRESCVHYCGTALGSQAHCLRDDLMTHDPRLATISPPRSPRPPPGFRAR